jgi:hypothetical protein
LIVSTPLSIFAAKTGDLNEVEFVSRDVELPVKKDGGSGTWPVRTYGTRAFASRGAHAPE